MLPIMVKLTSGEFYRHLDDAALGLVLADRCAAGTPRTSVHGRIYSVSGKAKPALTSVACVFRNVRVYKIVLEPGLISTHYAFA
jgi:hypothetical protein